MNRLRGLVLVLAIPLGGCETLGSTACDTSLTANPPIEFAGEKPQNGVYLSSPWDGPLLLFKGGMAYKLDHNLGGTPRWVSLWVSFSETGAANGGFIARASANEALIRQVDSSSILVQNGGCQDFWLLVAAGTGGDQPTPQ
jgi:hypothetical protein